MNTQDMNPSAERSRRKAVIAALLVALFGLTIAPGFSCSYQDGNRTVTVQSEE
jgi:hypothetical protein